MHRTRWLLRLLPLTSLASTACTDRPIEDADDEIGETADATTGTSDATTGTSDATDSTSESSDATSESSDSTGETSDTSSDSTDTGNDSCPPLPESPASFSYQFDIPGVDSWDTDITWTCTLLDFDTLGGLTLALECPDANGPVNLGIFADPVLNPPLTAGAMLTLRYVSEGPWWFNSYLRLDFTGMSSGHLLTVIDGDSLLPPDPYLFELPFPISTVSGVCDPVSNGCGNRERLGLAFELGGEAIVMFDPEYGIVGGDPGTDVWVDEASHLHDVLCTDTPDEWFKLLIANTGWE